MPRYKDKWLPGYRQTVLHDRLYRIVKVLLKAHDILEPCLKQSFAGPLEFGVVMFGTLAGGVEGRERRQFADNLRVGLSDCVSVIGCG